MSKRALFYCLIGVGIGLAAVIPFLPNPWRLRLGVPFVIAIGVGRVAAIDIGSRMRKQGKSL